MRHCPCHRNWGIIPSLYHKWGIAQATETGELSLHCIINEASPKPQKLGNYPFTVSWMKHRPSHRNWGIIPSLYHKVKHRPSHRNWGIIPSMYHKWGIAQATDTGELSLHCIINEALPNPQKLWNYPITVPLISYRQSHRNWGIIPSLYH